MSRHTFSVDKFGWVIATSEDRGTLRTQSVEAHLLLAILDELRDQKEWKQQHENLLALYRAQTAKAAPASDNCEHGIPRRFCTALHAETVGESRG